MTNPHPDRGGSPRTLLTLPLVFACVAGCASRPRPQAPSYAEMDARYQATYPVRDAARRVRLDGQMDEWPAEVVALADGDFIYVRFRFAGEMRNLQNANEPLSLLLDVDGNALTGQARPSPSAAASMGSDLEVIFSPTENENHQGIAVYALGADGSRNRLSHADVDFSFSPTYASDWYEARVSRHVAALNLYVPGASSPVESAAGEPLAATPPAVQAASRGSGIFVLSDQQGDVVGGSEPFSFSLPSVSAGPPASNLPIPPKRGDVIRMASYNVLHGSPETNPDAFARQLRAADPDIVLVQEWDSRTGEEIAGWFSSNVGGTWYGVARPQDGVGIVSRFPIISSMTSDIVPADGSNRPVRAVFALVQAPFRDAVVGSLHLKCCGSDGSTEDLRRIAEARAVQAAFAQFIPTGNGWQTVRYLGGDFNLVGSRDPLDLIRVGLDSDGSPLAVASADVLGDAAMYTWSDPKNNFSPGRLDFGIFGDANADAVNTFVLDTGRLSEESLGRHGLQREDSAAGDHRLLIVDLRPR